MADKEPETEAAAAAAAAPEEEEDDLEKLQAEIAAMEAEAARIARESDDFEKRTASASAGAAAAAAPKDSGKGDEKVSKDGWVYIIMFMHPISVVVAPFERSHESPHKEIRYT